MSAPAVPGANGSPTIEDSVSADAGIVSQLQAPAAPTAQETVPHTGQQNNIDPYFYEQFVSQTTLTWNTTMLPGTVLFKVPIHPTSCHQVVTYLSRIYNAWAGSLQFRLKIAGTGFHAGALGLARIPPNIDPNTLTTLSAITVFEWEMIDPKELMTITREVMDQRQIMFHYGDLDLNNINTFGGWFMIFVYVPLATSSTGLNQINIQVMSRLGSDFTFSQIKPPLSDTVSSAANPYNLLFASETDCEPYFNYPITRIHINPAAPLITKKLYGLTKLNAEPQDPNMQWVQTAVNPWVDTSGVIFSNDTAIKVPIKIPTAFFRGSTGHLATQYDWTTLTAQTDLQQLYAQPGDGITEYVDQPAVVVYNNESVVTWEGWTRYASWSGDSVMKTGYIECAQTVNMIRALRNTIPPNQTLNQCIKFIVSEKSTGLPIMYLKLYPEGIFTTNGTASNVFLTWKNYKIRFDSIIQVTDVLPNNLLMRQNYLMLKAAKSL